MRQGESLERGILGRLKDAKMTEIAAFAGSRYLQTSLKPTEPTSESINHSWGLKVASCSPSFLGDAEIANKFIGIKKLVDAQLISDNLPNDLPDLFMSPASCLT
jgi:hypothetical protein